MTNQQNYCRMNQLQGYIGNSPWCFSVDRARSFASDSFCPTPGIRRVENYQEESCSSKCKKCEAGGPKDGGTSLVNGVCTNYCSYPNLPQSYWKCGTGPAYKYGQNPPSTKGIDCRSCTGNDKVAWCKNDSQWEFGDAAYQCMTKKSAAHCINDSSIKCSKPGKRVGRDNMCQTCNDSLVICGASGNGLSGCPKQ
jgi:hypothetical protein